MITAGAALFHMNFGRKVRCKRWTEGCWVTAHYDPDIAIWVIQGHGSPIFCRDVADDPAFVLRDLLGSYQWEVDLAAAS